MALNRDSGGGVGGTASAAVVGLYDHKGGYNAATNTPDLDTAPSGVLLADAYTVTAAGTFFTELVEIGDVLVANQDNPTLLTQWTRIQRNVDVATTAVVGLVELATDGESAANVAVQGNDARLSDNRTDADAIHNNVAGEIDAVAAATVAGGDLVLIEDVDDSDDKKKVTAQAIADLAAAGVTDHGALTGLGDDDHTQYALADDRAVGNVQTTDATTTTVVSYTIPADDTVVSLWMEVVGIEKATGDTVCFFKNIAAKRISGTASLVSGGSGALNSEFEEAGSITWTAAFVASGTAITVDVTGEAAHTIDWRGSMTARVLRTAP